MEREVKLQIKYSPEQTLPHAPRLSFIEEAGEEQSGDRVVRLVRLACACGAEVVVRHANWRNGHALSCGCLKREVTSERSTTHGMKGTRQYRIWTGMIQRSNPGSAVQLAHPTYLGVSRDPKWDTFDRFWAEMGPTYFDGAAISRIGDTGDYTQSNCRWITKSQNSREAAERRMLRTSDGRFGADAARENGIGASTYRYRIAHGWSVDEASGTCPPFPVAAAAEWLEWLP